MERSKSESDTRCIGWLSILSKNLTETHLKRYLCMILSLNENRKPTIINEMRINEGLVMFDKEMEVFL